MSKTSYDKHFTQYKTPLFRICAGCRVVFDSITAYETHVEDPSPCMEKSPNRITKSKQHKYSIKDRTCPRCDNVFNTYRFCQRHKRNIHLCNSLIKHIEIENLQRAPAQEIPPQSPTVDVHPQMATSSPQPKIIYECLGCYAAYDNSRELDLHIKVCHSHLACQIIDKSNDCQIIDKSNDGQPSKLNIKNLLS